MADKRIIEQNASTTVPDDAYFIFDSALLGTFKISQSALLDFFGNATITEVTKAQYDALPDTKLTDGVLYAIKDQETSYVVDIEVDGSSILDEDGIADLSVISKIEEEIANAIAEEYDSTHTYYNTGLVFHEGVLYQCTATSVTGTWDSTKWNAVDIKDLLDNVSMNISYLWNVISNTIAGNYDTSSTYNTGDYVIYSLKLYRCKDDGVTGAWNSSKWEEVNIPEYIDYVLVNAGKVDDVKVDGTSVVTNKVAEIEIPVKDVQVKTDSTYDSVVDDNGNAKIDLSSVTAYGEVPNLPQAIATFKDGADAPMKSLKVAIEPQQDLHGYDSPWVGGAGKNKFDIEGWLNRSGATYTKSGNTYTITATSALFGTPFTFSDTDVTISASASSYVAGTATFIRMQLLDSNNSVVDELTANQSYQKREGVVASKVRFNWSVGGTFTITEPQVELGSTATSFAPYSNICPISGWSEANVTRTGKNLCNPEECARVQTSADVAYRNGFVISKVGTYTIKSYNNSGSNIYIYYKIIENGEYGTSQIIHQGAVPGPSKTITITEGKSIVIYDAIDESLDKSKGLFENVQIEVGSSATTFEPYNGNTYEISLGSDTIYGARLNVTTGEMVVDRIKWLITPSLQQISSVGLQECLITLTGDKIPNSYNVNINKGISDKLKVTNFSSAHDNHIHFPNTSLLALYLENEVGTTKQAWVDYLAQKQISISYITSQPTTVQLTPTEIKTLLVANNIWADTGDINECVYQRDMSSTIDDIIARLEALENA